MYFRQAACRNTKISVFNLINYHKIKKTSAQNVLQASCMSQYRDQCSLRVVSLPVIES